MLPVKIICALEAADLLKPPVERAYWVHPFHAERQSNEKFNNFFGNVRKYEKKFFDYFRMSITSFDALLNIIRAEITKQDPPFRSPISAEERLTITLRYLATGTTFTALQYEFYIAKSTIAAIVKDTCQAIWSCLKELEMPEPTEERWLEIAATFYEKTNFPNCVGAVDGKHIRCAKPKNSGSNFFNYKKFFSVVLMATVDANLCFIAIDVGAYGKEGDSSVFRDSALGRKLYCSTLNLPPPRCLPNTNADPQPFVIVGDEAFKLHTNLLRPYPQRGLTPQRRVYNYRLSRCRRSVECAFGVLANKWRVFHTPILVQPNFVDDIVKACCILHKFVRRRDGVNYEDTETYPFVEVDNCDSHRQGKGTTVRDFFANYFMGVGAVPFQQNYMY